MSLSPRVSVVIATYNRPQTAARLLAQLAAQDYPASALEVIVVDDGSSGDCAERLRATAMPCRFELIAQQNQGPARARHRGILAASGEIVVLLDDDMQVSPAFVAAHVRQHLGGPRRVVLGRLQPDPGVAMPLYERYHADVLLRFVEAVRAGRLRLRGTHVCTGNLSFRRDDYLAVGGFDATFGQSEDAELGVRLEKAGCELVFGDEAYALNGSDHTDLGRWLRRSFRYGIFDMRMARKHRDAAWTHPWRYIFLVSPLSRLFLLTLTLVPPVGRASARAVLAISFAVERLGGSRLSLMGATLAYGLLYFSGVTTETGSAGAALGELRRYYAERSASA
jgi:glycosyltransferase involved in cell wall biosynthesis